MSRPASQLATLEEYLRLEEATELRHEYVAGEIHALSGVSKRHNLIALNIAAHLRTAAAEGPCRVYMADVKLRAAPDVVYYPDVMVASCPEQGGALVEEAPCLVVEVTSPSTEVIDRREKLYVYKRLPGLEAYLIVDQGARRVDRHGRGAQGEWRHERVEGTGVIELPCPEGRLSLDQVYARVDAST